MRTRTIAGIAALAASGAAAVALTESAGGVTAAHEYNHIRVIEHATTNLQNDVAAPGDSPGDILTYNNPVFDAPDAKQVGTDLGWCIRVVAGDSWDCAWTTKLKGGQLMVSGPFYDTRGSQVAITGGTGRFVGAQGYLKLSSREGGKKYVFDFYVLR